MNQYEYLFFWGGIAVKSGNRSSLRLAASQDLDHQTEGAAGSGGADRGSKQQWCSNDGINQI